MITENDIARIGGLPDDKMVLMAVVNVNPAIVDNQAGALHTRAKSMMSDAGVPATIMNRVLDDIVEARSEYGKSSVFVVGDDLYERFDVQVDLPERYHYGRPVLAILSNVVQLMPTLAVLAVDREWARFFELKQGELHELRRNENADINDDDNKDDFRSATQHVPGTPGAGGSDQGSGPRSNSGNDLFQAHEDALQQRFYNQMVPQLLNLMKARDLGQLVLVGPEERLAEFKAELPPHAPFEVIGETNVVVGTGEVNAQQILDKIMPIVDQFQGEEETRLMEKIQEQGVMEMENVLQMVQQGQIYQLLIPEDGSQMHLMRSHNPEVPYFTSKKDVEESPLDGSLMERVTLEDVLPQLKELYGLEVKRMHGDHAEKLVREYGGLAGLPRY